MIFNSRGLLALAWSVSLGFSSPLWSQPNYDDLCPQEEIKLKKSLPPVLDQKRMNWCTTFSCAAGLSYVARRENPQLPDNFMFSPYDINLKYDDKGNHLRDHASLNRGGSMAELLISLQKNPHPIKSDKGLPFPFTEKDSDLEKLVDDFEKKLDDYITKNPGKDIRLEFDINPAHTSPSQHYRIEKMIAHSRGDGKGHGISVPQESLKIQDTLPKSIYPESYPSEISLHFHSHTLIANRNASSYSKYFQTLVDVLKKDTPVYIDTCGNQLEKFRYERDKKSLPKEWQAALQKDPCGPHQMLVVGIRRNAQGQCSMILQNSWGSDWGDQGRIEVPFSKIVDFEKSYPDEKKTLSWVEPSKVPTQENTLYFEDGSKYVGPTRGLNPDKGQGRIENHKVQFSNGESVSYNGEVKVQIIPGGYALIPHGKGISQTDDGFYEKGEFKDGRLVNGFVRRKLSSGPIFEGEIKDSQFFRGTLTDDNGTVRDVNNGKATLRKTSSDQTESSLKDP
jgi:hypothetical protein